MFNTLWRAISHFIDPVTKQKVGGCEGPLLRPLVGMLWPFTVDCASGHCIDSFAQHMGGGRPACGWCGTLHPAVREVCTVAHSSVARCPLPPFLQIHFVNFHAKKDNSKLEALLAR